MPPEDPAHARDLRQLYDRQLEAERVRRAARKVVDAEEAQEAAGVYAGALAPDRGWLPADIGAFLAGDVPVLEPTLMPRSDGVRLLYPGMVHSFHGESESGKSLVAQGVVAHVLTTGGTAAYVDFEADIDNVAGRILAMGVSADVLKGALSYLRPVDSYLKTDEASAAFTALAHGRFDVVVVDGVTDSLQMFGLSGRHEDDYTRWSRLLPRLLAERTGAAVVLVDHVSKDIEGRGRFAVGTQAKMNTITGAAYRVDVKQTLGRGLRGQVEMHLVKDRHGQIRPHCGVRQADRSQHAANVVIDSTGEDGSIRMDVQAPPVTSPSGTSGGDRPAFRPTGLMGKISKFMEQDSRRELTSNAVVAGVTGKAEFKRSALDALVEGGYVLRSFGPRNSAMHRLVRPYIARHDPLADEFEGVLFDDQGDG